MASSVRVCQMAAISAWVSFLTSHVLGDVAVVVWSVLCLWGFGVELASGGQDGCRACAYGVCGMRAAKGVAWCVVLGRGFCAAVGVFMT
jgi:hypothetical protein